MKRVLLSLLTVLLIGCSSTKNVVKTSTSEKEILRIKDALPYIIVEIKRDSLKIKITEKPVVVLDTISKESEISLLFIGDFMGHKDQINAAYNKETKTYEYDSCFSKVKNLLSEADVTIGNLEVTLGTKPYSGYPQFSSPASYAAAIKRAGVDMLTTANNHSYDKGKRGFVRTLTILDSLQIGHTGTFKNSISKMNSPAYVIEKNNFKIAIISYTYGTNGIVPKAPNIVNYLNKDIIKQDVEHINKTIKPDQIIAFLHWGAQYKTLPNTAQKEMFSYFKSLGVNIVIGAHPHVLQHMEWHKASKTNTKESLVVYSLGNFVSHQRTFPRDGGAVFKLTLHKNQDDKISIKEAKYHLTWVYEPIVKGKKEYYVLSAADYIKTPEYFTNQKDYKKMMRFITHARKLLGDYNINISED